MNSAFGLLLSVVIVVLPLTGCSIARYRATPLAPAETASSFESRNLSDSGLQSFVERSLGQSMAPCPPNLWDLQTLALIGLYFSPEMQAARARLQEAQCAIMTAAERPNPIVDFAP